MKIITIILGALICFTPFFDISADRLRLRPQGSPNVRQHSITSTGKKTGQFLMQGRGAKDSILLSNNIFYQPCHDHDAEKTEDWNVGDPIRVLKTRDDDRFILVNNRTGESMKAKILHWS